MILDDSIKREELLGELRALYAKYDLFYFEYSVDAYKYAYTETLAGDEKSLPRVVVVSLEN